MKEATPGPGNTTKLEPYLSPLAVWALSVGTAIGWGSLVVTSRTFLAQAGPLGSILGLLIGFAMMLMVARLYHFLANRYPGTGGLYNYVKYIFGYLMLEITESAYTGDSDQVISTAKELRGMGMGFRIEMDDFGTGYSSLGMLSNLPIDALKLDMSFIRSAFGETRDVRMIELIIDIADYLHVPVVAEGVETEEQYMVLKTMGCDLVQGYYFSKPVPPEAFDHFLIQRAGAEISVTPAAKKTYMSVSKALTGDFESIFYVDVVTDYYLEFHMNRGGDLEIRPGGVDFFGDAREKLLKDVVEADARKVGEATSKAGLMRWIRRDETASLTFRRMKNGAPARYTLQTIKTRESDDHHIVIGIREEYHSSEEEGE